MRNLFRKHVALTNEHGSWVFLFSPLLIGLFAAGQWRPASGWFAISALAVFLFRQPLTIAVKVFARRRGRPDLPAAYFWMAVYGLVALVGFSGLYLAGEGRLAVLAVPGLPILGWHLTLVSRREERRQIGLEIVASGVLALAATGAYWAGTGRTDPIGWWLWLLAWLQSAGSITYAALRLEQRAWDAVPPPQERLRAARRALLYTTFNLVFALTFGLLGDFPAWIWLAYAIQWLETVWGAWRPAIRMRPVAIGLRQLAVSTLFTAAFILLWG